MGNNFYFWAQSLDNESDVVATIEEGKNLNVLSDNSEIGKTKNKINYIVSETEKEIKRSNITIYSKGLEFVIEAFPKELDSGNRQSPIEIYGHIPVKERWENYWENLNSGINKFLGEIKRNIDENTFEEMKIGLEIISNKKKSTEICGNYR